jgi:CheY-like chemotaxis protein
MGVMVGNMQASRENITVLLVEDNEIDIMGVQRAFTQSHLPNPIVVARNGEEALTMLRDGKSVAKPYMILLDLNMPRMNGIEFLREARKDPALKPSIVFVLTTSKAPEDVDSAYAHNIAGYIVKEAGTGGFINAVGLLDYYSRIVEFPD